MKCNIGFLIVISLLMFVNHIQKMIKTLVTSTLNDLYNEPYKDGLRERTPMNQDRRGISCY